jgi:hypothetical protein
MLQRMGRLLMWRDSVGGMYAATVAERGSWRVEMVVVVLLSLVRLLLLKAEGL